MQGESTVKCELMEEASFDVMKAAVRGEIDKDFVAKYKDTLLCFRTPEVGNTIVHIAVRHRKLEVVKEAVSVQSDLLREKNNHKSTPLHEAAAFGDKETVQLLISILESSISTTSTTTTPPPYLLEENQDGDTPFHVALRSGNVVAAQELLPHVNKHHPEILAMKTGSHEETPLHLYVRYCTDEHFPSQIEKKDGKVVPKQSFIQELIEASGMAIFEVDSKGLNPVMRAAQHGRVLVIYWMLLLYPLSMLEWRDSKGRGFLHHLRLNKIGNATDRDYTTNICKEILDFPGVVDILICLRDQHGNATDRDYTLNTCKEILDFPGVLDILTCSRDYDGKTPLHLAILVRDFDLAQLILERYVEECSKSRIVSIKNTVGKVVYDLIISGPDIPPILKCLMEPASWGGVMRSGDDLYKAALNLDVDAAKQYFTSKVDEYGDYPNSQDGGGRNVLHIALQHHHKFFSHQPIDAKYEPFIEEVIERFPKLIFQKDRNGDTPLHVAARLSSDAATKLLNISFRKWMAKGLDDDDLHDYTIDLLPPPWKVKDSRGQTPLHVAACTDNLNNLDEMLVFLTVRSQTEALAEVNEYGETVIHLVARYFKEWKSVVAKVVQCDFGKRNVVGLTPRAIDPMAGAVQFDFGKRDVDGLTPMLRAAQCGRATVVTVLIDKGDHLIKQSDYKGRNVLHHLCNSTLTKADELTALIKFLERRECVLGVDELILSQDDDGNTPLHLAITLGQNFEVAEHLIRHCAQVKKPSAFMKALRKIKNKQGKSIKLLITCESGIRESLKELLDHTSPAHRDTSMNDDLYKAAKEGKVDFVKSLKKDELLYSYCRSHDKSNFIHVALRYRQLRVSKCVLEHKTYLELIYWKDSKGDTPLHLAARIPSNEALSFFDDCLTQWTSIYGEVDNGEVDSWRYIEPWKVKNSKGNTYLHEAAQSCNYEVIFSELLKEKDIQEINHRGETILHVIAKFATNAAKDFLKNMSEKMKSLIYIQDFEGFTPVLRALQYGRLGVAMLLIQQCPQAVEIPDKKGGTVLHHLKVLVVDRVDDGTDIFPVWDEIFKLDGIDNLRIAQNEDGNTALHLAIIDSDYRKTKFLMEKCLHSENKQELDTVNNDGHSVFDLIVLKAHIPAMKELQPLVSRSYIKERELMDRVMDDKLYKAAIEGDVQIFEPAANNSTTDDVESNPPTRPEEYFCSQTPSGSNIVHIALRHGKNIEAFIETALQKHPILSIKPDNNGDTPLHLAVKWKSGVAIVQSLLSTSKKFLEEDSNKAYHAPPWAVKNYKGSFPIHEALQSGNLKAAEVLLNNYDTKAASRVNDLGDTPLHSLAKNGFSISYNEADKFVKKLLDSYNQAAYVRDDEGLIPLSKDTFLQPLLCAARSGRLHVAQAILKHRPQSAYIRDLGGRTFLHLLRFTGEDVDETLDGTFKNTGKELFEFPEANAQRLVQDYDGNTPLHYAIINENSIAAIVLTYKCLKDEERRELGLVNKNGQTISDLLALHEVPNEIIEKIQNEVPKAVSLARSSYGIRKTEMKYSANALSVVAALLATITFAAGLQVPGGFDEDDGSPVLLRKPAFIVFVVANTIAMCLSMMCLFLLLWVMGIGKIHGSLKVLDISIILMRLSFYLTLLTFTMGVFVTTAAKSLWLGILVIGLGALTFLLTLRIPFIQVARCGVHATTCIKDLKKNVKSKRKHGTPTEGDNMTVDQTSEQNSQLS